MISAKEFGDFLRLAEVTRRHTSESIRTGQLYFNVFYNLHPEIANLIRGGQNDPFYLDGLIPAFLNEIHDQYVTSDA